MGMLFRLFYLLGPIGLLVGGAFLLMCVVHCVRHGKQQQWMWILLVFPGVGCLAYFFVEMLPTLRRSRTLRRANQALGNVIDPGRELRTQGMNLAISNNVQNTCQYAEQLARAGKREEALAIYTEARKGPFQYDPLLLSGMGRVLHDLGRHADAVGVLRDLLEHWPDQRRSDSHMLYAMALEANGQTAEADREYRTLADSFPGPEGKCRYARFLQKQGKTAEALELYRDVALVAQTAPKHYQRMHKDWIKEAEAAVKSGAGKLAR